MNYQQAQEFVSLIRTITQQELVKMNSVKYVNGKITSINGELCSIQIADSNSIINNISTGGATLTVGQVVTLLLFGANMQNAQILGVASGGGGSAYILPVATDVVLGGIKSGGAITIDANGIVGVNNDSHSHTAAYITNFDTAVTANSTVTANTNARHTHSNKAILDAITASYTTAEQTKLAGIAAGAEVNVQSDWNQATTTADDYIKNKPTIPTQTSQLTNNSNFVSDGAYVHTDNNYTTDEKNKLAGIEAGAEANNISDVNATDLTDAGDSALHYHSADRNRANHTGTQTASTISDFATTVRGIALTGLSTATNAAIVATDTLLVALGKLQKQITDDIAALSTHSSDTVKHITAAERTTWNAKLDATANAVSATKLVTARNINGVAFDGTADITIADSTKEPAITGGLVSQFWSGTKTWRDLSTDVRAVILTGLSTATNAAITTTDTILSALGKLQKQITDHMADSTAHITATERTNWNAAFSNNHAAVTVSDSSSIDLTLTGQQISASAIFGTTSGTVCQGNDSRLSDARTPLAHTQTASTITDFTTAALSAAPAETATTIGTIIANATAKATLVDADMFVVADSAAANISKKVTWGNIKTMLNSLYQTTLVSGTNIKTVNGNSLLGSGNITITGTIAWGNIAGTLSNQSDLNTALAGKEPTITKNTAFNKNYETTATNIKMNGTQAVGTRDTIARGDHVHPVDTSRAAASHTHTESQVTNLVSDLAGKQPTLVSGTNIKTINGNSVLGSGDLVIESGIANTWAGTKAEYDAIAIKDPETLYYITDELIEAQSISYTNTASGINAATVQQAIDELNTILGTKLTTTGLLNAIKAVDGTGSGIDADLLDGKHSSDFLADKKRALTVADYNNANYPEPYVGSTSLGGDLGLPASWVHIMFFRHQDNNGSGTQIALTLSTSLNRMWIRTSNGLTWNPWSEVITTQGGTMAGILTAQGNTSYTTRQVRNIIIDVNDANLAAMQNGDIWIKI